MDANKLKKLHVINYKIGTCGICKQGMFGFGLYGHCKLHTYNHLKHSDNPRQLSVYKHGRCEDFEADETNYESHVDVTWQEFLEK
jgi:hypothetical protein